MEVYRIFLLNLDVLLQKPDVLVMALLLFVSTKERTTAFVNRKLRLIFS